MMVMVVAASINLIENRWKKQLQIYDKTVPKTFFKQQFVAKQTVDFVKYWFVLLLIKAFVFVYKINLSSV